MSELAKLTLGQEGLEYVRACLKQGTGLSEKILSRISNNGTTFAPLGRQIDESQAYKFKTGGLTTQTQTLQWMSSHLEVISKDHFASLLVFQDLWALPSDKAILSGSAKRVTTSGNVYFVISPKLANTQNLKDIVDSITSYLFIAALIRRRSKDQIPVENGEIKDGLMDDWADSLLEVYVSAYDQEGLVVWSPRVCLEE